ncbi:hypothetical protein JVU11DRAFT_6605 [Chiua virens]|nr:hypothetical protein JVU11DRAFT_6605 [Chiua virens]
MPSIACRLRGTLQFSGTKYSASIRRQQRALRVWLLTYLYEEESSYNTDSSVMPALSSTLVEQVFLRQSFALAGNSLLIYDYFITLSPEVTYIWNTPWTLVKAGFFINRYGNLIGQMYILLEEMGCLAHGSQKFCVAFRIYCSLLIVFTGESIRTVD